MALRWLAGLLAVVVVGAAAAQTPPGATRKVTTPQPPVWRQLERFADDAEFLRYVGEVQRLMRGRYGYDGVAAADSATPPPPPPPPPPAMAEAAAPAAGASELSSITNVQTQGVDEGGIVKQIGQFLVVLQDGRLFVVDTRPNNQPGLALIGRTNVYRNPNADTWYDEVLVSGNRILVTGYSYRERASEITTFTIDTNGILSREATYYISSNDYYDTENYATRLVAGDLVIYTPLYVASINTRERMRWPLIRRWLRDEERNAVTTEGRPLFDGSDIYKPVQSTLSPMVHSVSVCPLGELRSGDELDCHTTAFVGGAQREFFVSTADIYLWVTPNPWDPAIDSSCEGPNVTRTLPATVYRVPPSGESPRALHARGQPTNQLALDASSTEFRALLSWNTGPCARGDAAEVRYFRAPFSAFRTAPISAPSDSYAVTPSPQAADYEVRFTGTHVVYGGRGSWRSGPPEENSTPLSARVVAVPVSRPTAATTIQAPHNIIRIERAGDDIVLTGYRTDAGLSVSLLDLQGAPRIASTRVLDGRFESEGRSHAFNSLIRPDGAGILGLPTVTGVKESGRWWFRSQASDVSYLTVDPAGRLSWAGQLVARQNAQHPDYRCEVSCVDWYGNTRALYIGERVFALSATELIEGALRSGQINETRRLNLSAPVRR